MNEILENELIDIARANHSAIDPSHDFQHALRVFNLSKKIAKMEGADLDIVTPASLFHDAVVYPKNSEQSRNETAESAALVGDVLRDLPGYPAEKIAAVQTCILQCSFSKGIVPETIEGKILQDADRLEATGAISIMRTFSSGGQMSQPFYSAEDPFYEKTEPEAFGSGIALFHQRLLVVEKGMHTEFARKIARRRTKFLNDFLDELKLELKESDILG
ncbi:MAG: HD domain-containing protein [Candidatus Moranbacteria bacterium]|nr:HD domain-containing protein [Candidatus Moranbacteria bacterium]